MGLTEETREFAVSRGAALVGIATANRFDGAPEGERPGDLLPGARAVVVTALRIPYGVFKCSNMRVYRSTASHLEHDLNRIGYDISVFLEDKGYLALPVSPDIPIDVQRGGGLRGDFCHRHAAVQAGLGWLGTSNLLLTPRFGPRVRLMSTITTAPLEADPMLADAGRDVCSKCLVCVKTCPAKAIQENGQVDKGKCFRQCMPYGYGGLVRFIRDFMAAETQEKKLELLKQPRAMELHQFVRTGAYSCANCLDVCPVGK